MGYIRQPTLPPGSAWSGWVYSTEAKANYVSVRAAARIAPGVGTQYFIQLNLQVVRNGVEGLYERPYGVRATVNGELSSVYEGNVSSPYFITVATLYYENNAAAGSSVSFTGQWYTQIIGRGSITVPKGVVLDIPVYVNVGGTVKRVSKAYINVGGTIKECTVYLNVGGAIKRLD